MMEEIKKPEWVEILENLMEKAVKEEEEVKIY